MKKPYEKKNGMKKKPYVKKNRNMFCARPQLKF